jgi:vacuolar-type H+-ATPase subunit E/Vma4
MSLPNKTQEKIVKEAIEEAGEIKREKERKYEHNKNNN